MKRKTLLILLVLVLAFSGYACSTAQGAISFKENTITLELGGTYQVGLSDTTLQGIAYSVDNDKILSINGDVITAVGGGRAIVTATYGEVTATMTVLVPKATPEVLTQPSYDTTVELAIGTALPTLFGGLATVPGSFGWVPGQVMKVGTAVYNYVFTPTDTDTYNTVPGTITLSSSAREPIVRVVPYTSVLTYGDALPVIAAVEGSTAGQISLDAQQTLQVGTHAYSWSFTPNDTAIFKSVTGVVSLTVIKATPTFEVAPYTDTLRAADPLPTLSLASSSTEGTVTFAAGQTLQVGTHEYNIVFIPTDADSYNEVSGKLTLTVSKGFAVASPVAYTQPLTYGDLLPQLTLASGSMAGTISLNEEQVLQAGTADYEWTFVPEDNSYEEVSGVISLTVEKAHSVVAVSCSATLKYRDALPSLTAVGTEGTVALDAGQTLSVGKAQYAWTFTPNDTANYNPATGLIVLDVAKGIYAATEIPSHGALSIQYRPAGRLSDLNSQLLSGFRWRFSNVAPEVPVTDYEAFYNGDSEKFEDYAVTITVNVSKADVTLLSQPTVYDYAYETGALLSSVRIVAGTVDVEGSFSWTDGTQTLAKGAADYQWTFTPTSPNYNTASGTLSVSGAKITPTLLQEPTVIGTMLVYGDTIPTLVQGEANVSGTFRWQSEAVSAGTANYYWRFYPDNDEDYNAFLTGYITLQVDKADSTVQVAPLTGTYTYGDALPALTLVAGGTPGTAVLDAGQLLFVGTQEYSWSFTPTDEHNYNKAYGFVSITVQKATYSGITHPTLFGVYGATQTLDSFGLQLGFDWADDTIIPVSGRNTYAATYNRDALNYNVFSLQITVVLTKAIITDIPQHVYNTVYSPTGKLSDVALEPNFRWVDGEQKPLCSKQYYFATYNPDSANYYDAVTLVRVNVAKADYSEITHAPLATVQYNPEKRLVRFLLSSKFYWADPLELPTVSKNSYSAYYNADPANYNNFNLQISMTVTKATPVVLVQPSLSSYIVMDGESFPTFVGGVITAEGSFSWDEATLVDGINTVGYSFVPTDTVNYNSVSFTTYLWQGVQPPTITTAPTVAAAALVYGDAMPTLSGGVAEQEGAFSWQTTALIAGTHSYTWQFIPGGANAEDYAYAFGQIELTVAKATYSITDPLLAHAVVNGTYFAGATLQDFVLADNFSWQNPQTAVRAGTNEYTAVYNRDSNNYNDINVPITLNIARADYSGITSPVLNIVYSPTATLADYSLPAGFTWLDGTIIPTCNTVNYPARYNLSANYNVLYLDVYVHVAKATPTDPHITLTGTYSPDKYLSDYLLSNGAAWKNIYQQPVCTKTTYDATFNPDSANYETIDIDISLILQRATPDAAVPVSASGESLVVGSPLPTLQGSFIQDGVLAWNMSTLTITSTASRDYAWRFTPADTDNYVTLNGTISLAAGRGTPTFSTLPSLGIPKVDGVYTLNYVPQMPTLIDGVPHFVIGAFSWSSGQALRIGKYSYMWQFVPQGGYASNYNTVTGYIEINVLKALSTVVLQPVPDTLYVGDPLPQLVLLSDSTDGTIAYEPGQSLIYGTHEYRFVFTPTEADKYAVYEGTVEYSVRKATPTVVISPFISQASMTYGDAMPVLHGSYSVAGTLTWDAPEAICRTGANSYAYTFTPTDSDNYEIVHGSLVFLTVRATPTLLSAPTVAENNLVYSPTLTLPTLTGGSASVNGSFNWRQTTITAGDRYYEWSFTPDEDDNYYSLSGTMPFSIAKGDYLGITHKAIENSYLPNITVARLPLNISFSWAPSVDQTQVLTVGTYSFAAVYNAQPINYNDFALNISVSIVKATMTVEYTLKDSVLLEDMPIPEFITCTAKIGNIPVEVSSAVWSLSALQAGTHSYEYTVTPVDTANINVYTGTKSFTATAARISFTPVFEGSEVVAYKVGTKATDIAGELELPAYHYYYTDIPVVAVIAQGFKDCTGLTSVIVAQNLVTFESQAFSGCTGLESVTLGTVRTLSDSAFVGCVELTEIDFGATQTIGDGVFSGCSKLAELTLPESVATLGDNAFKNCVALLSVTLGANVTTVGQSCFEGCELLSSITLNDGLLSIGSYAFKNCEKLASITFVDTLATLGGNLFDGCAELKTATIDLNMATLPNELFKNTVGLTTLTVNGDTITTIGDSCFEGCTLLSEVTLNASLLTIGPRAFYGCSKLEEITLPSTVTTIADYAFAECTFLGYVALSADLVSIGAHAFEYAAAAADVAILYQDGLSTFTTIGEYAFAGGKYLSFVPKWYYENHLGQNGYKGINFDSCSSLTTIGIHAFDGVSCDFITLKEDWTELPDYLLYNVTCSADVAIPDEITSFGDYCFAYSNLPSLLITNDSQLDTIGYKAFEQQKNYEFSLFIPSGVDPTAHITSANGTYEDEDGDTQSYTFYYSDYYWQLGYCPNIHTTAAYASGGVWEKLAATALIEIDEDSVITDNGPHTSAELRSNAESKIHFSCQNLCSGKIGDYPCDTHKYCDFANMQEEQHKYVVHECGCSNYACQTENYHGVKNTYSCGCIYYTSVDLGGTTVKCPSGLQAAHEKTEQHCDTCDKDVCEYHFTVLSCGCLSPVCAPTQACEEFLCEDCDKIFYLCQHTTVCNECSESFHTCVYDEVHLVIICTNCRERLPSCVVTDTQMHLSYAPCGCEIFSCIDYAPGTQPNHSQITFDCGHTDYSCKNVKHEMSYSLPCGCGSDYACSTAHAVVNDWACGCKQYQCNGSKSVNAAHEQELLQCGCTDYTCKQLRYGCPCGAAKHILADGTTCENSPEGHVFGLQPCGHNVYSCHPSHALDLEPMCDCENVYLCHYVTVSDCGCKECPLLVDTHKVDFGCGCGAICKNSTAEHVYYCVNPGFWDTQPSLSDGAAELLNGIVY